MALHHPADSGPEPRVGLLLVSPLHVNWSSNAPTCGFVVRRSPLRKSVVSRRLLQSRWRAEMSGRIEINPSVLQGKPVIHIRAFR
jgi:hypothetical protein